MKIMRIYDDKKWFSTKMFFPLFWLRLMLCSVLIRDSRWWWCLWNYFRWFIIWFTFDCHRYCLVLLLLLLLPPLFVPLILPAFVVWSGELKFYVLEIALQSTKSFINSFQSKILFYLIKSTCFFRSICLYLDHSNSAFSISLSDIAS